MLVPLSPHSFLGWSWSSRMYTNLGEHFMTIKAFNIAFFVSLSTLVRWKGQRISFPFLKIRKLSWVPLLSWNQIPEWGRGREAGKEEVNEHQRLPPFASATQWSLLWSWKEPEEAQLPEQAQFDLFLVVNDKHILQVYIWTQTFIFLKHTTYLGWGLHNFSKLYNVEHKCHKHQTQETCQFWTWFLDCSPGYWLVSAHLPTLLLPWEGQHYNGAQVEFL